MGLRKVPFKGQRRGLQLAMDRQSDVHPNPAFARKDWLSLDGLWHIEHNGRAAEIRVPFPVGSEASGVDFPDRGKFIYSRSFRLEKASGESRYFINVGAADYFSEMSINGIFLGGHIGGYASFRFDATEALRDGDNEIKIIVRDSHHPGQVRGKQTFLKNPFLVWYQGFAGMWQSVWLERTGRAWIESLGIRPDFGSRRILVSANVAFAGRGSASGDGALKMALEIVSPRGMTYSLEIPSSDGALFSCAIPFDAVGECLWSPWSPDLYRITLIIVDRDGDSELDRVDSYFGLRNVEARDNGIYLNGEAIFLRMALVQGYYPGGGYTPVSPEAIEEDINALKRMGYNGARIHEKIESPRFHYLCDKLGLLTTFEMPSFYWPSRRAFSAYEQELREIVGRDAMHPSSIAWVLFNETWGVWGIYRKGSATRRFVERMLALVRSLDPDRPVIENSGWEHFDTDIVDFHHYLGSAELAASVYAALKDRDPDTTWRFTIKKALGIYLGKGIAKTTKSVFLSRDAAITADAKKSPWLLSEYGGFGWYLSNEAGSVEDKIERYTDDIVNSGIFAGYCLTQLYDVGNETNGLLTADRRSKVNECRMRRINGRDD